MKGVMIMLDTINHISSVNNLENYDRIVVYDDSERGAQVWHNGDFVCNMEYGAESAIELVKLGMTIKKPLCVADVWLEDIDSDDDIIKLIHLFAGLEHLSPEQEMYLINGEYSKL
jgi:hypothetical protein